MRPPRFSRHGIGLLAAALLGFAAVPAPAQTPAATADEWVGKLAGPETPADLDIPALRQQAMDRIKARAKLDAAPLRRAQIAPDLLKLPQVAIDIQFDEDATVVRPESYQMLGRVADTLYHPSLSGSKFLIVGHTVSTGKRDYNLILSQRRADAIRDIMIGTFKVSPKRLQAIGLGEEQMLDNLRPAAPVNAQVQLIAVGKLP